MFVPLNYQDFFVPSLNAMRQLMPSIELYTKEQFFSILNWVIGMDWTTGRGFVNVMRSADGTLLGYGCGYEANQPFDTKRNLHTVAIYSKTKNTRQTIELVEHGKQYAKEFGYDTISGVGGRLNGSRRRFWQEKLGFQISYIGFIYHV